MKVFKAIVAVVLTVALILVLEVKLPGIPPIAVFLNPATGFWQNAESKHISPTENLKLPGLIDEVIIKFDTHMIPHIFAQNDHDLYYAQGFVTARARLWEMDIQTRSAAGRLAEIVGPAALENDRYQRRMGMVYGAENSIRRMMQDPVMSKVIQAYTDGINAYIHQLSVRDYPIEFKLLDYKPEDWKPINCAFLLKLMSETLAGGSNQFAMTNTLKRFGPAVMNDLFPDYPFREDPIIPAGTKWNFKPLPIPKPSASFIAQMTDTIKTKAKVEGIGSNNWAVSGSKTASGYPILANDPHLDLTFPSIWYQVQLCSPDVNVNGVSLPGSPNVIIGYNQKASWGLTNVGADVLDWYQIKFKDNTKQEYWYNNRWNKVNRRVEVINIRGEQPEYDTILYTHHGPVVYESAAKKTAKSPKNIPVGDALRWIAHDESDDIMCFYLLNRAKNYSDYREALTYLTAPAQNFVFADADNDIGIIPNGKFPLKFKDQGKYILDGSDPANDWHGFIPYEQNPTVKNPPRGFVNSANQSSTDPSYPYYINWQFEAYERGKRINDRLAVMKNATVDSMRILQTDTYSIRAQNVLPAMLGYVDPTKLDDQQEQAYQIVKKWDKYFAANSVGATIFNAWWIKLYGMTWNNKFKDKNLLMQLPSADRTVQLLTKEPNSKWFDNVKTPIHETGADIVYKAFTAAVDELIRKHGKPGEAWELGHIKPMEVAHVAKLDGFGSGNFVSGGSGSTIDALVDGHGPSWRMVVQLGPKVKGYGIIPGGESGNPGSYYYNDMFQTWKDGKLDEMLFMAAPTDDAKQIKTTLTLTK